MNRLVTLSVLLWLTRGAHAAITTHAVAANRFAVPADTALPGSTGGLLRVVLALIVVLAAVVVTAWLARRMRALSGGRGAGLSVLAQVSLGARERAVLLQVGDRQLLVGVGPGNVRALHVLELSEPQVTPATAADAMRTPGRPTFKALLLRSLGK